MVPLLSKVAGVEDPNALANELFQAKSKELLAMSAYQIVTGDIKTFDIQTGANGAAASIVWGAYDYVNVHVTTCSKSAWYYSTERFLSYYTHPHIHWCRIYSYV